MRYAIVSDLHANQAAWQTVLTDIADMQIDKIICLGDIVGYGPNPVEVLESVYRLVHVALLGNHDAAVAGKVSTDNFSTRAAHAVKWHRTRLSPSALKWLAQLPLTYTHPEFRCAHSEFSNPGKFQYVIHATDALPSWQSTQEQLLFIGHSHLPGIYVIGRSGRPHFITPRDFELEEGKRYLINPGSIGYPRAGDRRSSYCIYDDATRQIFFRQLPFDSAAYLKAMQGSGMDDDPWIQQQVARQKRTSIRKTRSFNKLKATAPTQPTAKPPAQATTPSKVPTKFFTQQFLPATIIGALVICGTAWLTWLEFGKKQSLNTGATIPPFELPVIIAFNRVSAGHNLLPTLPTGLTDGRLNDWRYTVEKPQQQHFYSGHRDGALTLRIHHEVSAKVILESPLINLDNCHLKKVRLRARVRKPASFQGTATYQVMRYRSDATGHPIHLSTQTYEMNSSRRKLTPPGAERDVAVKLSTQCTHVRLRIQGDFTGELELEQPELLAEKEN